jgi:hypothetical protein
LKFSQAHPTFPSFHWTFLQVHPNLSIFSSNFPPSISQSFYLFIKLIIPCRHHDTIMLSTSSPQHFPTSFFFGGPQLLLTQP